MTYRPIVPAYITDGANLDAFSRLRVSSGLTTFATQTQYDLDALRMEYGATGTGAAPTLSADTRMVTLSATTGSGTAFAQSYQYHPYQPGKSQLIFITGVMGAAVAAAVKDVGYFDASNGVFYRQNGTSGLEFVRRTKTSGSVVDNTVAQADWNLDKLNGTGASGYTLTVANAFILVIDLQFLGMGRVRMGFDIDGEVIYAHEFRNANVLTVPYMQTAALPVQALLTATATGGTATLLFKCASVVSEGGFENGLGYAMATPEATVTAGSATRTSIISIRPKTTFNSLVNREMFRLDSINLLVTGNYPILWELCLGATFSGGPTWADVNGTYSGFEYGHTSTLTAVGLVVASGYVPASATVKGGVESSVSNTYPITLDRAGAVRANGTYTLVVTGIGGTSATRATLDFTEYR